jgi:hypothetical protein
MTKLFAVTVMSICLIMSVGFYGIAGAEEVKENIAGAGEVKEQAEEMINVNRTLEQDTEAAAAEGEEVLEDTEMKEGAEEMIEGKEMAEDTLKEETAK